MTEREMLEYAAKAVSYNPKTGVITWLPKPEIEKDAKRWNARYANKEAGTLEENGYVRIVFQIDGKKRKIRSHRLAWFISTGSPPTGEIDHINQIKTDNRIANLRDVGRAINQRNGTRKGNNTSGVPGVCWHKQRKKWCAQAAGEFGKKTRHIGLYETIKEAEDAVKAYRAVNGYTETHGRAIVRAAAEIGKAMP